MEAKSLAGGSGYPRATVNWPVPRFVARWQPTIIAGHCDQTTTGGFLRIVPNTLYNVGALSRGCLVVFSTDGDSISQCGLPTAETDRTTGALAIPISHEGSSATCWKRVQI